MIMNGIPCAMGSSTVHPQRRGSPDTISMVLHREKVVSGEKIELMVKKVSGDSYEDVAELCTIEFAKPEILEFGFHFIDGLLRVNLDMARDRTINLASIVIKEGDFKPYWHVFPMTPLKIGSEFIPLLTFATVDYAVMPETVFYSVEMHDESEGSRFFFKEHNGDPFESEQFVIFARKVTGE